jgi:hypothetical protein
MIGFSRLVDGFNGASPHRPFEKINITPIEYHHPTSWPISYFRDF